MDVTFFENQSYYMSSHLQGENNSEDSNVNIDVFKKTETVPALFELIPKIDEEINEVGTVLNENSNETNVLDTKNHGHPSLMSSHDHNRRKS